MKECEVYGDVAEVFETVTLEELNKRLGLGWRLLAICKHKCEIDVNVYAECPKYVLGLPKHVKEADNVKQLD